MKIAILAPTVFPTTDNLYYGGAELFTFYLCKALGKKNIDYTLFASKGSKAPNGTLVETIAAPEKWGTDEEKRAYLMYKDQLKDFDLIHDHTHRGVAYNNKQLSVVHTFHGISTWPKLPRNFPRIVTLSEYHRKVTKDKLGCDSRVVGIGTDPDYFTFNKDAGDYYLHFGLISEHKGADVSASICKQLGVKLVIAGEDQFGVDPVFVEKVKGMCDNKQITYLGRVDTATKYRLIANAKGVLLPFKFGEANSQILAEALMSGTPVVITPEGAMPELMGRFNGQACFMDNLDKWGGFPRVIDAIKRSDCRRVALEHYNMDEMAAKYIALYDAANKGELW